jgi:eukaryotic-like serine/threonine-protein kinase
VTPSTAGDRRAAFAISGLNADFSGRYRVERELGRGGMATVYLAHDAKHGRLIALKVLHPELSAGVSVERFLLEIHVAAGLMHPNILPLHDSGTVAGTLYYVMPYVDGESLRDFLLREHRLPVTTAIRMAREVAEGLDYAHRKGVVHRDIKPENILLVEGHAIIADFGIARALERTGQEARGRLTSAGMVVGTPQYMSPEQSLGDHQIDGRSDVYSLACVLNEMVTGAPPFSRSSRVSGGVSR